MIRKALRWLISEWYAHHGSRRKFVAVPKFPRGNSAFRESPRCFSRAWKGHFRNLAKASHAKPGARVSRSVGSEFFVLHVDHILPIVEFDLEYGLLYFGGRLFCPTIGMTQGSNLSPGVCNAVCVYLERQFCSVPPSIRTDSIHHLSWLLARWVDDIFGVLCFWLLPG